jgi:hypothetical protein
MTTTAQTTTRVLLATIAGALALLAAGAGTAAAAPAASQVATNQCWKDVINDWLHHQPDLTGIYAIPCYSQAIQHLDAYQDVASYSSAADDIRRAMLAVIHQEGRGGPGSNPPGSDGSSSGVGIPQGPNDKGGGGGGGIAHWLGQRLGPGNAQSVPLPLIVLAGLALLLLLAAAGTWFARRLQTRRMTPAPAPAPRR